MNPTDSQQDTSNDESFTFESDPGATSFDNIQPFSPAGPAFQNPNAQHEPNKAEVAERSPHVASQDATARDQGSQPPTPVTAVASPQNPHYEPHQPSIVRSKSCGPSTAHTPFQQSQLVPLLFGPLPEALRDAVPSQAPADASVQAGESQPQSAFSSGNLATVQPTLAAMSSATDAQGRLQAPPDAYSGPRPNQCNPQAYRIPDPATPLQTGEQQDAQRDGDQAVLPCESTASSSPRNVLSGPPPAASASLSRGKAEGMQNRTSENVNPIQQPSSYPPTFESQMQYLQQNRNPSNPAVSGFLQPYLPFQQGTSQRATTSASTATVPAGVHLHAGSTGANALNLQNYIHHLQYRVVHYSSELEKPTLTQAERSAYYGNLWIAREQLSRLLLSGSALPTPATYALSNTNAPYASVAQRRSSMALGSPYTSQAAQYGNNAIFQQHYYRQHQQLRPIPESATIDPRQTSRSSTPQAGPSMIRAQASPQSTIADQSATFEALPQFRSLSQHPLAAVQHAAVSQTGKARSSEDGLDPKERDALSALTGSIGSSTQVMQAQNTNSGQLEDESDQTDLKIKLKIDTGRPAAPRQGVTALPGGASPPKKQTTAISPKFARMSTRSTSSPVKADAQSSDKPNDRKTVSPGDSRTSASIPASVGPKTVKGGAKSPVTTVGGKEMMQSGDIVNEVEYSYDPNYFVKLVPDYLGRDLNELVYHWSEAEVAQSRRLVRFRCEVEPTSGRVKIFFEPIQPDRFDLAYAERQGAIVSILFKEDLEKSAEEQASTDTTAQCVYWITQTDLVRLIEGLFESSGRTVHTDIKHRLAIRNAIYRIRCIYI